MVEWSQVSLTECLLKKRMDAEFFRPEYIKLDSLFDNIEWDAWGSLDGRFITGPFGSTFTVENLLRKGTHRYIRGKDVKPFVLVDSDAVFIPFEHYERLEKHALQADDLLISVVGTLGNACLVPEGAVPAIFSSKSTAYRSESIDPYYLAAYLNCEIGRAQLLRHQRGAVLIGLNLDDLKGLRIPRLKAFEARIGRMVKRALAAIRDARTSYASAIRMLDEEVGQTTNHLTQMLGFETSLARMLLTRRFDAEYFNPTCQDVVNTIRGYRHGYERLLDNVEEIRPGFDPSKEADRFFSYVELADIDSSIGLVTSSNRVSGAQAPSRARRVLVTNDVIASSVSGSIQKVALIIKEHDGLLASTGFFQFRSGLYDPLFLLILTSYRGTEIQLKREATGAILSAVSRNRLNNVLVPKVPAEMRNEIANIVRESHAAFTKAVSDLELTQHEVETAIRSRVEA